MKLALTGEELTGYQKAEFAKSSKWRIWLIICQFLASLPAAFAVVVTNETAIYFLAIVGVAMLAIWWWARARYMAARSAAHSARRASLVVNGLGLELTASEHQRLRQLFTVNEGDAARMLDPRYYASQLSGGASRLGEILEESAFYSKAIHAESAKIMTTVLVVVVGLLAVTAFTSVPFVERATALVFVKIVLAASVFVLSSDVIGSIKEHREAYRAAGEIQTRMSAAFGSAFPVGDVILAMADYNNAMESAPEAIPGIFKRIEAELNRRWAEYVRDREIVRTEDART
jgi:hypothetical protein